MLRSALRRNGRRGASARMRRRDMDARRSFVWDGPPPWIHPSCRCSTGRRQALQIVLRPRVKVCSRSGRRSVARMISPDGLEAGKAVV